MTISRRPFISGNWKMHKTGPEAVESARALKTLVAGVKDVDIMIAPTFTALAQVAAEIEASPIALGAQNMHWESKGAFTGEIAPEMLKSAGCSHVIIGHSERRQYFDETDQSVNRKIKAAIAADLVPVFCIGETETQRDDGETFSVLDKQVQNGLETVVSDALQTLIVAYEPVWAIGTGKTATTEQAQEVHAHVRQWMETHYDAKLAQGMRIIYG